MESVNLSGGNPFSWGTTAIKVIGALVVGIGLLLYANQDKLLYFPQPPQFPKEPKDNPKFCRSPSEWKPDGNPNRGATSDGIPFEDHLLKCSDGARVHIWLMLQPNSKDVPTLVYFHGNAGNMGFRLKNAAEMYAICKINVLMMDYRGYGSSEGTPNEKGLNIDAVTVLNFALNHSSLENSPIVAFGRSLGGAVSIELANRNPDTVKAVIVENTFLSISSMVDKLMPLISFLKPLVLSIGWYNDQQIQKLQQPILFVSGDSDELVPPSHMKRLYELAASSIYKDFYSISGGHHNDSWERAGKGYYLRMKAFLDRLRSSQDQSSCDASMSTDASDVSSIKVDLPTMTKSFGVK